MWPRKRRFQQDEEAHGPLVLQTQSGTLDLLSTWPLFCPRYLTTWSCSQTAPAFFEELFPIYECYLLFLIFFSISVRIFVGLCFKGFLLLCNERGDSGRKREHKPGPKKSIYHTGVCYYISTLFKYTPSSSVLFLLLILEARYGT